jgi:hypothetical protein
VDCVHNLSPFFIGFSLKHNTVTILSAITNVKPGKHWRIVNPRRWQSLTGERHARPRHPALPFMPDR